MDNEVDMELIIQEWKKGSQFRDNYTRDFPDLDKLVDGAPLNREGGAPYVGDTTVPALTRSIPRDSIQQLPIFGAAVNGTKNSIPSIISSFLLRSVVFNENTFGKGILSTVQIGAEQALAHGYAPFMTATGSMFDEFGTSMRLMHWSDVAPETGIQSDSESGFWYVEADITKTRLRKIIRNAEGNENTSWYVDALKELSQMEPAGTDYQQYASNPRAVPGAAGNATGTYRFVTCYEVGKRGRFVTFCPQLPDKPLRTLTNRSKFGYPRVQLLVIDPAPLTPFGVSRVRLASPNANLMNAYYMNIVSMLILNSKPPILQRGRFTTPVQLKQGVRWETIDQNAIAELVELDNGSLQFFPQMAQQFAGQIQNIMGGKTGSVSGGTKSAFGKTAPGERRAQAFEDSGTNQITNILENFLRQYALVALDTYICEQSGEQKLTLDDEAKNAINRLLNDKNTKAAADYTAAASAGQLVEEPQMAPLIGDDNKFTINWEDFYLGKLVDPADPNSERVGGIESWKIEIELSIGKDELEENARGDMQDMLTTLLQNDDGTDPEMKQKIKELIDRLLEKTIPESKRLGSTPALSANAAQAVTEEEAPAPAVV